MEAASPVTSWSKEALWIADRELNVSFNAWMPFNMDAIQNAALLRRKSTAVRSEMHF
jgi:hypothetical protein